MAGARQATLRPPAGAAVTPAATKTAAMARALRDRRGSCSPPRPSSRHGAQAHTTGAYAGPPYHGAAVDRAYRGSGALGVTRNNQARPATGESPPGRVLTSARPPAAYGSSLPRMDQATQSPEGTIPCTQGRAQVDTSVGSSIDRRLLMGGGTATTTERTSIERTSMVPTPWLPCCPRYRGRPSDSATGMALTSAASSPSTPGLGSTAHRFGSMTTQPRHHCHRWTCRWRRRPHRLIRRAACPAVEGRG